MSLEEMKTLLEPYERTLLHTKTRLYVMLAYQAELDRVSRGKPFRIWNDIAWRSMIDVRDSLVIHLSSWTEGVYQQGGLFGKIKAGLMSELAQKRKWGQEGTSEDRDRIDDKSHAKVYQRLFPANPTGKPGTADIDALKDQFVAATQPMRDDRNTNRAHPYERIKQAKADMLDFQKQAGMFEICERLLNDLRLVSAGETFEYHDVSATSSDQYVADVVDMVLCGTSLQIEMARSVRNLDRESFYARLHEVHGGAPPTTKLFNDDLYPDGEPAFE